MLYGINSSNHCAGLVGLSVLETLREINSSLHLISDGKIQYEIENDQAEKMSDKNFLVISKKGGGLSGLK